MSKTIDNHESLPEYQVAKKVWDDIHNNDTLIYNNFEDYFLKEFYLINSKEDGESDDPGTDVAISMGR